ncbi:hypothetical protein D3C81_1288010 [compost metagenome]
MQAGFADLALPFGGRIVTHVARVAQHLDGLQVGVEQRAARRHDIDEGRHPTRLQYAAHFAQGQAQVAPVVRRVAAEDEVERGVGERQAFGGASLRGDIAQAALGGGAGNHIEHGLRQVVGDHFGNQWRNVETDVTGTTAQVQHAGLGLACQFGLQQGELGALGVYGAAEVGAGLFAELALDHVGVGGAGHGAILLVFLPAPASSRGKPTPTATAQGL